MRVHLGQGVSLTESSVATAPSVPLPPAPSRVPAGSARDSPGSVRTPGSRSSVALHEHDISTKLLMNCAQLLSNTLATATVRRFQDRLASARVSSPTTRLSCPKGGQSQLRTSRGAARDRGAPHDGAGAPFATASTTTGGRPRSRLSAGSRPARMGNCPSAEKRSGTSTAEPSSGPRARTCTRSRSVRSRSTCSRMP